SVHFDGFHRHADRLVMANIAQTVNVLQAMILTDGDALVLTPSYHVFAMNKGHHDADSLPLHLRTPSPVRTVGDEELQTFTATASTKDGRVLVSLTNLDAADGLEVDLDLRGAAVSDARVRLLTADELAAHNTADATPVVVRDADEIATLEGGRLRVRLPQHSFATVSLAVTA
ncbi:alpha-L-arabinofuranosidase C-terminal domain-containing protein, partial [Kineococcus terrestris]|uniref:alpha-L-arabinofuranosidase C-terminal domain-containing protein n=1 Tax=Kineococcus terrestris TaxID=2044856 RepID=UPI0034DB1C50